MLIQFSNCSFPNRNYLKMKQLVQVITLSFLITNIVFAQVEIFTLNSNSQTFPSNRANAIRWADFNNDGLLDYIVLGRASRGGDASTVYEQTTSGFVQHSIGFNNGINNVMFIRDLNQDGLLDIVVSETSNQTGESYEFYENLGGFRFQRFYEGTSGYSKNVIEIIDIDRDGKIEIIHESRGTVYIDKIMDISKKVFWNTHSIKISERNFDADLFFVGDYFGDGFQDIFVLDQSGISMVSNLDGRVFEFHQIPYNFEGYFQSGYMVNTDSDAALELVASIEATNGIRSIYSFEIDNLEVVSKKVLSSNSGEKFRLLDVDHDGNIDLIEAARYVNNNDRRARISFGDGQGNFINPYDIPLGSINSINLDVGDFDNDADLDLLLVVSGANIRIYENNISSINPNLPPTTPENIGVGEGDDPNTIRVVWDVAHDDHTKSDEIKYQVIVKNEEGQIVTHSYSTNQIVSIPSFQYFLEKNEVIICCLPIGSYSLAVQSIDGSILSSVLEFNISFTIDAAGPDEPTSLTVAALSDEEIELTWQDITDRETAYHIYKKLTSAQEYDLVPTAVLPMNSSSWIDSLVSVETEYDYKLVPYNCAYPQISVSGGVLSFPLLMQEQRFNGTMNNLEVNHLDLGDFDGDGDKDLLAVYSQKLTVFRNDGNSWSNLNLDFPATEKYNGGVSWVDIDGDNDLDIFSMGNTNSNQYYRFYENKGNEVFEILNIDVSLWPGINLRNEKPIFSDFDNDGDLDLTIKIDRGSPSFAQLKNDDGRFAEVEIQDRGTFFGRMPYGDFDNDGDADMLVFVGNSRIDILENDGFGNFSKANTPILSSIIGMRTDLDGASGWFHADDDELLDLFIAGRFETSINGISEYGLVLRNTGGDFEIYGEPINIGSDDITVSFGDIDGDGDSDFFVQSDIPKLFINEGEGVFKIRENLKIALARSLDRVESLLSDLDGDGDIDLLLFGEESFGNPEMFVYNNVTVDAWNRPNINPSVPTNITFEPKQNGIMVSWDMSQDDITPDHQVFYYIFLEDIKNDEVVSPLYQITPSNKSVEGLYYSNSSQFFLQNSNSQGVYAIQIQATDGGGRSSEYSKSIPFNLVTGFDEDHVENENNIYPNPATEFINVSYSSSFIGPVQASLTDANGQKISSYLIHKTEPTFSQELDVSQVKKGVYILRLMEGTSVRIYKLFIQR